MKILSTILMGAMLALAGLTAGAAVAPDPVNAFAVGSTNRDGTLSYAIVSPRGTLSGAAPRVQFINAGSDKATAKVQSYKVVAQATATFTNSTTTLFVNSTNTGNNWQSGVIIVRHLADDSYEKRTLTANTGSTNIIVTAAPLGGVVPGDIVYLTSTTGAPTIYWGGTTNSLNGNGAPLLIGQKDKPLLLEIDATTAGQINVVAGDYVR